LLIPARFYIKTLQAFAYIITDCCMCFLSSHNVQAMLQALCLTVLLSLTLYCVPCF